MTVDELLAELAGVPGDATVLLDVHAGGLRFLSAPLDSITLVDTSDPNRVVLAG